MHLRQLAVLLLAAAACGKGHAKSGVLLALHVSDNADPVQIEIPGAKPVADMFELPALPPAGTPITLYIDTPCGHREGKIPFPDLSKAQRMPVESGPYEGLDRIEGDLQGLGTLVIPEDTMVYVDPKLKGPVLAGTTQLHNGDRVFDLACAKKLSIGGAPFDLPPPNSAGRRPALLVTASTDACFRDESVGYGDAASGGSTLKGSRVYLLSASTYQDVFQPPDATARAAAGQTGTSRYAVYEVPCP